MRPATVLRRALSWSDRDRGGDGEPRGDLGDLGGDLGGDTATRTPRPFPAKLTASRGSVRTDDGAALRGKGDGSALPTPWKDTHSTLLDLVGARGEAIDADADAGGALGATARGADTRGLGRVPLRGGGGLGLDDAALGGLQGGLRRKGVVTEGDPRVLGGLR